MPRLLASVFDNPIFVRELRCRMRGRAIIFSLLAYVILMCALSFIVIFVNVVNSSLPPQEIGQNIGQAIFYGISIIQVFLVLLAAPSITSSMTTAEREKQTFEFLQATTLSARDFVIGNLLSTFMYVLIVLVCAMPVISVTFLYGGISVDDVLTTFGILLALSLLLTCFALLASSINTKTRSVQALVTVVCVLTGIFSLTSNLVFSGFRAKGGVPFFLRPMPFLGSTIPAWVVYAVPFLTFCAVMIIAAGRKLYEPDNRLLNYRQFLVIFVIFNIMFVLGHSIFGWLFLSPVMLYLAAMNFSTGRPFLGDETWVIKRHHPVLRRVDEGLLYMVGMAVLWAAIGWFFGAQIGKGASSVVVQQFFKPVLLYGFSSVLLYYCIGRVISQYTHTRLGALQVTLFVIGLLFFVLPVIDYAVASMRQSSSFLFSFCPLKFFADAVDVVTIRSRPLNGDQLFSLWNTAWFCSITMLVGAAGCAFLWMIAARRHKLSNYHFDLNWPVQATTMPKA